MCVECRTRADIQDSRFKIQDSRFVLVPSFSLTTSLFRTEREKIKIYNSGGYFIFYLELVFYSYSFYFCTRLSRGDIKHEIKIKTKTDNVLHDSSMFCYVCV